MFRHELSVIGLVRAVSLLVGVVLVFSATYTGLQTRAFIGTAKHASGRVVADGNAGQGTVIEFTMPDGVMVRRRVFTIEPASRGSAVGILYTFRDGVFDVRLDRAHDLWAPMWHFIEWAIAALLTGIYGRALVRDPMSVIGFKGWRVRRGG